MFNKVPLKGLVLAGGKSVRMGGADKGKSIWHNKEQRLYVADLLSLYCTEVLISCRKEQIDEIPENYRTLTDRYEGGGPICGILSAFDYSPESAWLVVACDLPLIDADTIEQLVKDRALHKKATTFVSPHDGLPEPLITIWEPAASPLLTSALAAGRKCPRKVLMNTEVELLIPRKPHAVLNVNTPEDAEFAKKLMGKHKQDY